MKEQRYKNITIMHGDCNDVMANIKKKFDVIVTSPPYDAGKEYEGERNLNLYKDFSKEWTSHIPGILNKKGSFWLNVGYTSVGENETLPLTYLYHEVRPKSLKLIQEVVWEYGSGMRYTKRFPHRSERWQWYSLNPSEVYFDLDSVRDSGLSLTKDKRSHEMGKAPTDCWYIPHVVGGTAGIERPNHPCPFPEKMIERILTSCCPAGGSVLDPFGGSGTVGVVASRLGMDATLIELNEKYIPDMCKRIEQSQRQYDMFRDIT